jgi:hypothetical protein
MKSASEKTAPEQTTGTTEEGKPSAEDTAVKWSNDEVYWDADEKKPEQEDDNVSTVTPVSLPDSLPSVDQTLADNSV